MTASVLRVRRRAREFGGDPGRAHGVDVPGLEVGLFGVPGVAKGLQLTSID